MSFPLVDSEQFAKRVAERVAPAIRDFPPRSLVTLRTFGVYDPAANPLRFDKQISSINRAADVASAVETIIASVPSMVASGKLKAQPKTNIVAFLETMAQSVDCKKNKTAIVLVSDGIEDSDYATSYHGESAFAGTGARSSSRVAKTSSFLGLAWAPTDRRSPSIFARSGRPGRKRGLQEFQRALRLVSRAALA